MDGGFVTDNQSSEVPLSCATPFDHSELSRLMAAYASYVFVTNEEGVGARAMFRGRWQWRAVEKHLDTAPKWMVVVNERASGFVRYRLYGADQLATRCLAEVEIYFSYGHEQQQCFWYRELAAGGAMGYAA